MEDRIAKQILSAFADSRLNTAHLGWLINMSTTKHIDTKLKEFFYYYTTFYNQDTMDNDVAWLGEKILQEMKNPLMEGWTNPPPPDARIVFD